MDWDAIGAIGEIVGALAVVVTLGFLAVQLRANSAALKAQTQQALADHVQDRFLSVAANPEFAAVLARARSGEPFESFDEREQEQLRHYCAAVFGQVANYFSQHQLGTVSIVDWETRRDLFLTQLETPAYATFWEAAGEFHGKAFAAEINRLRDTR